MPIKGVNETNRALRRFVNNTVPSRVRATTQEIALFALEKAIDLSPFLTGRFVASWRVSLSESVGEPAPKGKRSFGAASAESFSASQDALNKIDLGTKFYVGNAAPYAEFVEFGSPTTEALLIGQRVSQAIGGKFGRITR